MISGHAAKVTTPYMQGIIIEVTGVTRRTVGGMCSKEGTKEEWLKDKAAAKPGAKPALI